MAWLAFRMLTGCTTKYLGMLAGVTISSLLIAQQCSMFCGMLLQTASPIRDVRDADIWVMAPDVHFVDELHLFREKQLNGIRGTSGVEWAVPFFRYYAQASLPDGSEFDVNLIGLDDHSLIGGPQEMLLGQIDDLQRPDAVIIDLRGYNRFWPGEPLSVGRQFEISDQRCVLVGVCKSLPTYQTLPIIYTRYSLAKSRFTFGLDTMSFVLVKASPGSSVDVVCQRIANRTGLRAMTRHQFIWATMLWFLRTTEVIYNFAVTVVLGFVVGIAIAGTMFHLFTIENLTQFGTLKALGATNAQLIGLLLTQGLLVGLTGYGLGLGLAALLGECFLRAEMNLTSYMPWEVLAGTALAVIFIIALVSVVSIREVAHAEAAVAMRQ